MQFTCPQCQHVFEAEENEGLACPQCQAAVSAPSLEDAARALKGHPVTQGFSDEELSFFASWMTRADHRAGDVILEEGAPSSALYFLADGTVEIWKHDPATGRDFRIKELLPGAFFAEMSFLSGDPVSATVKAKTDAAVRVLEKEKVSGHPLFSKLVANIARFEIHHLRDTSADYAKALGRQYENVKESELYFRFLLHVLAATGEPATEHVEGIRAGMESAGIDEQVAGEIRMDVERLEAGEPLDGLDALFARISETDNANFIMNLVKDAVALCQAVENGAAGEALVRRLVGIYSPTPDTAYPRIREWALKMAGLEAEGIRLLNSLTRGAGAEAD